MLLPIRFLQSSQRSCRPAKVSFGRWQKKPAASTSCCVIPVRRVNTKRRRWTSSDYDPGRAAGLFCITMPLLEVKNLQTHFPTRAGLVKAVDGVSFDLDCGVLLGFVGESGCGKSITALSVMRLIAPPGKIAGGEIVFDGRNLLRLSDQEMRQ